MGFDYKNAVLPLPEVIGWILVLVVPLVVQFLKKYCKSDLVRFLMSIGISVSLGTGASFGSLSSSYNLFSWIIRAVLWGQISWLFYKNVFRELKGKFFEFRKRPRRERSLRGVSEEGKKETSVKEEVPTERPESVSTRRRRI